MKRAIRNLFDSTKFAFVMLLWLLFYAVPRVHTYVFPPVSEFVVTQAELKGGSLYVAGTMFKERCRFAGINVTGKRADGREVPLPILFMDAEYHETANRQRGPQEWGPWRIGVASVESLGIESSHWCHSYGIRRKWAEYGVQTALVKDYAVPKETK